MNWDEELPLAQAVGAVVKFKDVEQPGVPGMMAVVDGACGQRRHPGGGVELEWIFQLQGVIPGAGRGRLTAVRQDLSSGTGELADCPHQLCSLLWAMPTMTHCHTPGLWKDLHVSSSTPNPK